MVPGRTTRGTILLLGLAACQPSPADEPPAETQHLQAIDDRLAAIETKLAAIETKLDANASDREALRAAAIARGRLRLGDGRQPPDLADPLALPADPPPFEGAESIECKGFETANIECEIDRAFVDSLLASPESLARQARIVPSVKDGETQGFKVYGIRPGSLPKLVGIMNGDTITSVGGKPLDSMEAAMDVYAGVRKGEQIVVALERKNTPVVLTIDIVE